LNSKTLLLIVLTMMVPASMFLVPAQAQEDQSLVVSTSLGGSQDIPLKAIKEPDGNVDTQNDFEIEPSDVVTIEKGKDLHVIPNQGTLEAVKATDEKEQTTNLIFFPADGRVRQDLESKAYLLDVIVDIDGDLYLYETVLAVVEPGQTINQVNIQNIVRNFVSSTSSSHTAIVFKDDNDNDNGNEPDNSKEEICRFTPNHPICAPGEDGECDEGFAMNEDGNCFPRGDCPDGYHRANDDETGACISEDDLEQCPDGSWQHPGDTCFGQLPASGPEAEPECEEGFVLENGECAALDSNCGGEPCTASEKEDSTTSDPVPAEPEPEQETDSEETEGETEEREEETETE
jgi:hypothetical protein